jgi:hypothetical protein
MINELKNLVLIDVKQFPVYLPLLKKIEEDAVATHHRNSKNYYNLEQVVDSFLSYELLIDQNGELVASSGLQLYPNNTGRVASRTYTMSKYRKNSGASLPFSENMFVPYEIEVAKQHNLQAVFFTVELLRRRNAVKRFCKNLQSKGLNFNMHHDMVNTCRKYVSNGEECINYEQPCWQNAGVCEITGPLLLPTMSVQEYKDRYYNEEVNRLC